MRERRVVRDSVRKEIGGGERAGRDNCQQSAPGRGEEAGMAPPAREDKAEAVSFFLSPHVCARKKRKGGESVRNAASSLDKRPTFERLRSTRQQPPHHHRQGHSSRLVQEPRG